MFISGILKSFLKKNTYLNDWFFRNYRAEIEERLREIIVVLSEQDSLLDVNPLLAYKDSIERKSVPFWSYDINTTNSRMYGIHSSVFTGINDRNVFFPSVEHGLIFHNRNWTDTQDTVRASCITFGDFRKAILQRCYDTPIFCVGPYIHYARDYYQPEVMVEKKTALGKNLLVFPTHGTDDANVTYHEKVFIEKILSMKKDFDSITACIYWWNLDTPLVQALKKEGCHIVSAGFREDPRFLSRLKAIIDLSDFVMGDSVGTHIGYCINRQKPFCYFDASTTKKDLTNFDDEDQAFMQKHIAHISSVFLDASVIGKEQLEVYRYYWGGDHLRTCEEIYEMYRINKDITQACHGNKKKFGAYARTLLCQYPQESVQHKILKEAIAS